jgi:hypothetical protein
MLQSSRKGLHRILERSVVLFAAGLILFLWSLWLAPFQFSVLVWSIALGAIYAALFVATERTQKGWYEVFGLVIWILGSVVGLEVFFRGWGHTLQYFSIAMMILFSVGFFLNLNREAR